MNSRIHERACEVQAWLLAALCAPVASVRLRKQLFCICICGVNSLDDRIFYSFKINTRTAKVIEMTNFLNFLLDAKQCIFNDLNDFS